jgi:hypothetical protein
MIIQKHSNGSYYLCISSDKVKEGLHRDWWLVKNTDNPNRGYVPLNNLTLPKEFIGRRVRFKLEILR